MGSTTDVEYLWKLWKSEIPTLGAIEKSRLCSPNRKSSTQCEIEETVIGLILDITIRPVIELSEIGP